MVTDAGLLNFRVITWYTPGHAFGNEIDNGGAWIIHRIHWKLTGQAQSHYLVVGAANGSFQNALAEEIQVLHCFF